MDRKKKEGKEPRVSTTDSPSWEVVEQQREGLGAEAPRPPERETGAPSEPEAERSLEPGPGNSAPNRRA